MTIKRLVILQAVLLLGLGLVFFTPKYGGEQPLGVTLELPAKVGDWTGQDKAVSDKEKQVLGLGTEFSRKLYTDPEGNEVFVSIVLSGHDVNTSLHRPERCLPAQGWNPIDKSIVTVPVKADSLTSLQATRLRNEWTDGPAANVFSIYYYWFVGCKDLSASPFQRSLIDWRDRIFKGYDQRWAYVTMAATIRGDSKAAQEHADATIKALIAQLFPKIWKPSAPNG